VPRKAVDRAMFLALHGKESDVDAFPFVLAEALNQTVGTVMGMPMSEYMGWQAYLQVRAAQREAMR